MNELKCKGCGSVMKHSPNKVKIMLAAGNRTSQVTKYECQCGMAFYDSDDLPPGMKWKEPCKNNEGDSSCPGVSTQMLDIKRAVTASQINELAQEHGIGKLALHNEPGKIEIFYDTESKVKDLAFRTAMSLAIRDNDRDYVLKNMFDTGLGELTLSRPVRTLRLMFSLIGQSESTLGDLTGFFSELLDLPESTSLLHFRAKDLLDGGQWLVAVLETKWTEQMKAKAEELGLNYNER